MSEVQSIKQITSDDNNKNEKIIKITNSELILKFLHTFSTIIVLFCSILVVWNEVRNTKKI